MTEDRKQRTEGRTKPPLFVIRYWLLGVKSWTFDDCHLPLVDLRFDSSTPKSLSSAFLSYINNFDLPAFYLLPCAFVLISLNPIPYTFYLIPLTSLSAMSFHPFAFKPISYQASQPQSLPASKPPSCLRHFNPLQKHRDQIIGGLAFGLGFVA